MNIASSLRSAWSSDVVHLGATAGLVAGALLLSISAWSHRRGPRPLLASLLAHGVLSYRYARATARAAVPVQVFLAVATTVALATGGRIFGLLAAGLTGLFFGAMSAYLAIVLSGNANVTCACFGKERPLNWLVVGRAVILGAAAGAATLQDRWSLSGQELLVVVLGAAGASALLVWLPGRMGAVTGAGRDGRPVPSGPPVVGAVP